MAASPSSSDVSSKTLSPRPMEASFRPRGSWSRSGCLTCKRRRKKCDERKPKCSNCTRLGHDCEGYATLWITPMNTSTKNFQNSSKTKRRKISKTHHNDETYQSPSSRSDSISSSDNDAYLRSPHFTPESISSEDDQHSETSTETSQVMSVVSHIDSTPIYEIGRSLSILQSSESFFIQYHVERGSQLLSNLEVRRNPLNEVLIPRALSSPLLLNCLCALSAGHMSNWDSANRDMLRKAEMTYYGKTVSGVRKALTDLSQQVVMSPTYMSSLEEVIAAIASLCKYEVVQGSVRSWRGHLEALQRLVTSCGGLTNLSDDIADWLSGLLTYWQYMANLIKPNCKSELLFCEGLYQTPKIDIYSGCSQQLVKICSRIADLQKMKDFASLNQEVIEINEYLCSWSCREQYFITSEGITEASFERLEMVANYFRYAAFIFLHSTIERIAWQSQEWLDLDLHLTTTTTPVATYPIMWDTLHSLVSFSKPEALQKILSLLHSHPPDEHSEFSALTFSLFIAGCECEGSSEELSSILGALKILEMNFGVRNTRRAQELIKSYWGCSSAKRQGRHWLDLLGDMDWDLILV